MLIRVSRSVEQAGGRAGERAWQVDEALHSWSSRLRNYERKLKIELGVVLRHVGA